MRWKDPPNYQTIEHFARKYKEFDRTSVTSWLGLLGLVGDLGAAIDVHFERHGLSKGRFMVLIMLLKHQEDGLSPATMAEACCVTRATMTGLVDTLESAQLVERTTSPDDRRMIRVRLTSKGLERLDRMLPDHYARIAKLMKHLTKAEHALLLGLIAKLRDGLPAIRNPR